MLLKLICNPVNISDSDNDKSSVLEVPGGEQTELLMELLPHLYHCASGELIWEIYQCDGKLHCNDSSDEVNCK